MFEENGILYADSSKELLKIQDAKPLFDATILNGPAFAPLSDEKIFKDCKVVDGIVTWMDEDIDCAPEYMYEHSYAYPALRSAI